MKNMKKSHHNSKTNHKNLISRWVRVTIWYKLFSWSKIPRKKFFHKNFLMREFSPSDIWIDVFRKFCCDINKYHICLVIVYFGECTWPVAFERTHLQGLTHSRSWDIWIDVHVVFRWFQPYSNHTFPPHWSHLFSCGGQLCTITVVRSRGYRWYA